MSIIQSVIQSALKPYNTCLLEALQSSLKQSAEHLFEKARVAESNEHELELFTQYKRLSKITQTLIDKAAQCVPDMPGHMVKQPILDETSDKSYLSMVGFNELDAVLAYSQMESLLDIRFYAQIHMLEKRNKALYSHHDIDKASMPFGPASISWVMREVFRDSELNISTQVLIINRLAAALSERLQPALEAINAVYQSHHILPNLKPEVRRHTRQAAGGVQAQTPFKPSQTRPPADAQVAAPSPGPMPTAFNNAQVAQLFDLMNQRLGHSNGHPANVSSEALDRSLGSLGIDPDLYLGSEGVAQVKQQLRESLQTQTGLDNPTLQLQQESALDVMGLVLDELVVNSDIDQSLMPSINQLQVPLLRTVTSDLTFFDNEAHPARTFLENLIAAGNTWYGTTVVKDLEKFSHLVSRDFDGSPEAFTRVQADLEKYLKIIATKAHNAEKKHKAEAQGRERLKKIHRAVDQFIERMLADVDSGFVEYLLEFILKDALTLTLLREGKDSDEWKTQVTMIRTIIQMTDIKKSSQVDMATREQVVDYLRENMFNLGFSKTEVDKTVRDLARYSEFIHEKDTQAIKMVDQDIESFIDLKKTEARQAELRTRGQANERPLTQEELQVMDQVKAYPFGSYFDFLLEEGDQRRKKLCWLSPMSNTALFVNPLGRQPLEKPLPQLAIEIVEGKVVYITPQEKGFISRALGNVYSQLKKMGRNLSLHKKKPAIQ